MPLSKLVRPLAVVPAAMALLPALAFAQRVKPAALSRVPSSAHSLEMHVTRDTRGVERASLADGRGSPDGVQIVTGWLGSVAIGFLAWRTFDEPAGKHSAVKDDWGYTPRAHTALIVGSFVGATLGVGLKGHQGGAGGNLLATAGGVALPTLPLFAKRDDPLLPFMLAIAFAPVQSFIGYELYKVSAPLRDSSPGAPAVAAAPARKSQSRPNLIVMEEFQRTSATNVYDAIQQLRPQWLAGVRLRSPAELEQLGVRGTIVVYLGGVRYGSLESLRELSLLTVTEIRFLDAREATSRYGTGHTAGAIDVIIGRTQ